MRVILGLLLLLLLMGCGGGGQDGNSVSSSQSQGSTNFDSSSQTATVVLRFNLQARTIPNYVTGLRVYGLSSMGDIIFGPVRFAKEPQIVVPGVPTSCTQIRIEMLQDDVIRGFATLPVSLQAGETLELSDPPYQDVAATLRNLRIESPHSNVPAGTRIQFVALGRYEDGNQQDLSSSVKWTSNSPTVAEVDVRGVVSTRGPGEAEISAQMGNIRAQFQLTVRPAELVRLKVNPATLSMPKGTTQELSVVGVRSDESELPVNATWSSNSENVSILLPGQISADNVGQAVVEARLGDLSDSATVTVTDEALVFVQMPASLTMAPDTMTPLTLTGIFTDGTSRPVSDTHFVSSDDLVVSVLNNGTVTAKSPGQAVITATDLNSGKLAQTAVRVINSQLETIAITPSNPWIETDQSLQMRVTGVYLDGSTVDLTHSVQYQSENAHLSVSNTFRERGLVQGHSSGVSRVTATHPGTGITDSTTVRVLSFAKKADITVTSRVIDMAGGASDSTLYFLTSRGVETLNPVDMSVELRVAGTGNSLELSPDGGTLLVTNNEPFLRAIDTHNWSTRQIEIGSNTKGAAFASSSQVIAISSNSLHSINLEQGTVLGTLRDGPRLGSYTGRISIDRESQQLFVAHIGVSPSSLFRYNLNAGIPSYAQTLRSGENGRSLKVNQGRGLIYVCGTGNYLPDKPPYGLDYYAFSSLNVIRTFAVGPYPVDAAFSPDGSTLFTINTRDSVAVYREDNAALYSRVALGLGSNLQREERLEVTGNANYLFVSSFDYAANRSLITVIERK